MIEPNVKRPGPIKPAFFKNTYYRYTSNIFILKQRVVKTSPIRMEMSYRDTPAHASLRNDLG